MLKKWLYWINLALAGVIFLLLCIGVILFIAQPSEIPFFEGPVPKKTLPKSSFSFEKEIYDAIGEPVLSLQYSPLSMQLPDLRKSLVYYGKNGRPDVQQQSIGMFFSFTGNKTPSLVVPGQKTYISYDKNSKPPQYVFSHDNTETQLWITAVPEDNQAQVSVGMRDESGKILTEPQAYAQFVLPEKEFVRNTTTPWEIGKLRVDGTLLARQKARWYGTDKFLEKHGGPEYAEKAGKQRIDFSDKDENYSVYIGPEDGLIWVNNRWKEVKPGPDSVGYPLLTIKKIDDRLMTLELWEPNGKSKITLNLLKSTETWTPQNIQQSFKFIGARTRSQFVFEINKEKMMLSPKDWLLFTEDGWKKLTTPEAIDDYVERRTTGPLFVFDAVEKHDDRQVLIGTLFNSTRTEMQQIEIPLQQQNVPAQKETHPKSQESPTRPLPPAVPVQRADDPRAPATINNESHGIHE